MAVPQQHRVADPGRDRLGVADVQRQARPAEAGPELPPPQEPGQPARAGQQVHGLADHGLLDAGPAAVVSARVRAVAIAVAEPVQFHAQPHQVLQRVHVDVAGHDRGHRRVTRDRRGGVAVQPRPVGRAGLGRGRAAGGPPRPDPLGPLLLQGGVGVEQEQVGQGDVRPGLDRLPGPLRQQPGRGQSAHRLGQRVVVPLPLGPVVVLAAGADSASSTAATAAAHSAVRSPCRTPAPPMVVASFTSRSANSRPGS